MTRRSRSVWNAAAVVAVLAAVGAVCYPLAVLLCAAGLVAVAVASVRD